MDWVTKFDIKDVSYARLTFHFCIDYKGTMNTIHNNTITLLPLPQMLCRKSYRFANRPNRGDHRYSHAQLQKKWREKKRNRLMEMPKVLTLKGKFTNAPVILFTYFS